MAERGPRRVFKAVLNYGLGSYLPQIVNFVLVPVYTRYIEPKDMGLLEVAFGIQGLLVVVMRLGLPGALGRLFFEVKDGTPEFRSLVLTLSLASTISSLAVVALLLVFGPAFFGRYFPEVPFYPYLTVAMVGALMMGTTDIQRRLLQSRERSGESARLSAMMASSSTVLTLILVVGAGMGAIGTLWASFWISTVFAAWAIFRHRADLRGAFSWRWFREGLAYGAPLVPNFAAAWLQQNLGRFFLLSIGTSAQMGVLAVAGRVASPLAVVTSAFVSAYSPVYFSWRKELPAVEAANEARRIGGLVAVLGGIAVVGAGTFGAVVMRHVMAESYQGGSSLVGVVAAAFFLHLLYTLVVVELFFSKKTNAISVVFILAAAANSLLVWFSAPRFGAMGAAVSQVVGGVVSFGVVSVLARRKFPLPVKGRSLVVAVSAVAAGVAAPFIVTHGSFGWDLAMNAAYFGVVSATALTSANMLGRLRRDVSGFLARRRAARGGASA